MTSEQALIAITRRLGVAAVVRQAGRTGKPVARPYSSVASSARVGEHVPQKEEAHEIG